MKSGIRSVAAGLTVSLLSACMSSPLTPSKVESKGPSSEPAAIAASDPTSGIPSLPENYKTRAAIYLVSDYIADASGPAEISGILTHKAPLGASSQVIVRYPVSAEVAAKRNFMARFKGGTYYRCGSITAHTGLSTLGEAQFMVGTAKLDNPECNPSLSYSRYKELEDLAAQCRDPNKSCEVVTRTPLGGTVIRPH